MKRLTKAELIASYEDAIRQLADWLRRDTITKKTHDLGVRGLKRDIAVIRKSSLKGGK